jgi:hypothetical protein
MLSSTTGLACPRRVTAIVMDAMTDEDQRGIAKQHNTIGIDFTSPECTRRCRSARWPSLVVRAGLHAIHDVVFLDQCEPGGPCDLMFHQDEYIRMQPDEIARPIHPGWFVPWMRYSVSLPPA